MLFRSLLFLETGQYFGTSQNGIEDKKNGTEGVEEKLRSSACIKFDEMLLQGLDNLLFINF